MDSYEEKVAGEYPLVAVVDETGFLILDIAMPGMSGFDLQRELKQGGYSIPIIFISGRKDEVVRSRAFQQGAVEFLFQPFSDTALLQALNTALRVR